MRVILAALLTAVVSAPAPAAATPADDLMKALLTVDQLPPGYEVFEEGRENADTTFSGEDLCDESKPPAGPGIASVYRYFITDDGRTLINIIAEPGAAKARGLVREIATAPDRCPVTTGANGAQRRYSAIALPGLDADAAALIGVPEGGSEDDDVVLFAAVAHGDVGEVFIEIHDGKADGDEGDAFPGVVSTGAERLGALD
ncbi:hypothetical protein [Actinoplanes sp. NBRC 101535]|uniref:hypothetical protein n=1 Tax=Actinoplanes sp. NBRC 101535 TaxID=3032196 RepID=UPI0024A447A6|nr:hypothetical protein [Actinoplanes sp. NBRC 101535]GLX99719.1 hypothetical protein Acsp01_00990 [Actinoplanes sp. NBRC 101535]